MTDVMDFGPGDVPSPAERPSGEEEEPQIGWDADGLFVNECLVQVTLKSAEEDALMVILAREKATEPIKVLLPSELEALLAERNSLERAVGRRDDEIRALRSALGHIRQEIRMVAKGASHLSRKAMIRTMKKLLGIAHTALTSIG